MKDNFSAHSAQYLQFRPNYPTELFDFLKSLGTDFKTAWDCGTGNGQLAVCLAKFFDKVYATDLSEKQIANAILRDNIVYKIEYAEHSSFEDNQFDLIAVAQAIHWFHFDDFYKEVNRTLKPGGYFAAIGYSLLSIDSELDPIIQNLYYNVIGKYWDKERKYIDEEYRTIPFPFKEVECPRIKSTLNWSFDQLIGYLNTWSAVQHYIRQNNTNPVDLVYESLYEKWGNQAIKNVNFPILLRVGQKEID